MTEFLQTLTLTPEASVIAVPSFEDNINVIRPPAPTMRVTFNWSPNSGAFSYEAGFNTYTPAGAFKTPALTPITFTATVEIPVPLNTNVIEYRWDFGDDTIGYGNPVTHIYLIDNPQLQCSLRVTDSDGDQWYCRHQMYLEMLELIIAPPSIVTLTT